MKKLLSAVLICTMMLGLSANVFASMSTASLVTEDIPVLSTENFTTSLSELESSSLEKYNTLLKEWSPDPDFPDDRTAAYPSFFGGAYIDEDKTLVINVTSYDKSTVEYFASFIDLNNVRFSEVSYSLIDLLNTHDALKSRLSSSTSTTKAASNQPQNIEGTGISIIRNAVNLYVTPETDTSLFAKNPLINELTMGLQNVQIVPLEKSDPSSGKIDDSTAFADSNSTQVFMNPGSTIYIQALTAGSVYPYGIGFWASDSSGNLGIVTAGHGYMMPGISAYADLDATFFGTIMYPVLFEDGVDACFIKRENSAITPSNYVTGWNFSLKSRGHASLVEGSTVYMRAPQSGCRYGDVIDMFFNPHSYDPSVLLEEAVLTSCYAEQGDSGGVVAGAGTAYEKYLVGIVSGGKILSSTNQMYYTKAFSIISRLGVSVY